MTTRPTPLITYSNKRRGIACNIIPRHHQTSPPSPFCEVSTDRRSSRAPDGGGIVDEPLQSLESMERRMLKRSRNSSKPLHSVPTSSESQTQDASAFEHGAYMDQLPLETPLPSAARLSETFHLHSGVGKAINPDEFSPMPKLPVTKSKRKENRTFSGQSADRRFSRDEPGKHMKEPRATNSRLSRTQSGNLKENSTGTLNLPTFTQNHTKLPIAASRSTHRTRNRHNSRARPKSRRSSSRASSCNSFRQPLSSPFNSQPPSAASSPKTSSASSHIPRPVKSKTGEFKVPLLPKAGNSGLGSSARHFSAYGSQSTATSPAHSAICVGSSPESDQKSYHRTRRPSAPPATRPEIDRVFPTFNNIHQAIDHTEAQRIYATSTWGTLGVSFDRPPSQLDYTHTYMDPYCLAKCELEGVDADLMKTSPLTSDLSNFWVEVRGASTPFLSKERYEDTEGEVQANADSILDDDDDADFEGEASTNSFPLTSAPGYKTPELQPLSIPLPSGASRRPSLRSFFSDTTLRNPRERLNPQSLREYSPAKAFHSPRSGKLYYSSPRARSKGKPLSPPNDFEERLDHKAGALVDVDDTVHEAEVDGDSGMSWLSDSLISPPTALVKRLAQTERYKRRFPTSKKYKGAGECYDEHDGTMDMELDSFVRTELTLRKGPSALSSRPVVEKGIDDYPNDFFKSVNISSGSLKESPVANDTPAGVPETVSLNSVGAVCRADPDSTASSRVVKATDHPLSPSQSASNVINPPRTRNRRGTIKASDYPNAAVANSDATIPNVTTTQRTRSGTITARSASLGQATGLLGGSMESAASGVGRRTRSGTIIGPPVSVRKAGPSTSSRSVSDHMHGLTVPAESGESPPLPDARIKINNIVTNSPNSATLSSSPDSLTLAPPIDLNDEVWQVEPRVFSPDQPPQKPNRIRALGLRPLRLPSTSRSTIDAPRMRVVQTLGGGPKGGSRGMGAFAKLSTLKCLDEDERSSDDELLLLRGGGNRPSDSRCSLDQVGDRNGETKY